MDHRVYKAKDPRSTIMEMKYFLDVFVGIKLIWNAHGIESDGSVEKMYFHGPITLDTMNVPNKFNSYKHVQEIFHLHNC